MVLGLENVRGDGVHHNLVSMSSLSIRCANNMHLMKDMNMHKAEPDVDVLASAISDI